MLYEFKYECFKDSNSLSSVYITVIASTVLDAYREIERVFHTELDKYKYLLRYVTPCYRVDDALDMSVSDV